MLGSFQNWLLGIGSACNLMNPLVTPTAKSKGSSTSRPPVVASSDYLSDPRMLTMEITHLSMSLTKMRMRSELVNN